MKETNAFYKSQAWINLSKAIKKERGGVCELCKAKGIISPGEIVHHIKPITVNNMNNPTIALNPNNLLLVCRKCHGEIHGGKRYRVDNDGRILF